MRGLIDWVKSNTLVVILSVFGTLFGAMEGALGIADLAAQFTDKDAAATRLVIQGDVVEGMGSGHGPLIARVFWFDAKNQKIWPSPQRFRVGSSEDSHGYRLEFDHPPVDAALQSAHGMAYAAGVIALHTDRDGDGQFTCGADQLVTTSHPDAMVLYKDGSPRMTHAGIGFDNWLQTTGMARGIPEGYSLARPDADASDFSNLWALLGLDPATEADYHFDISNLPKSASAEEKDGAMKITTPSQLFSVALCDEDYAIRPN